MKQEWKDKWTAALRSGKYKQGKGKLRNFDNTYCCLGVLCDILPGGRWKDATETASWYEDQNGHHMRTTISFSLLSQIDLPDSEQIQLIRMNDAGRSFEDIADYIEGQL
jgi:hypothetical protein